jgi:PAS domain S-box-containing protein
VLATIVDVSARKRAEERFRAAVESSPHGMLMIDRDGRLVLVNKEIERMFGYERVELLGQSIELLVPARFRAAHPAHRGAFFAQPQTRAMGTGRDLFGVRKDGTEIPVEIGLNPIETEEGLFVLGSVVDISGRKRAELDRRRLEDQLRQAQKMEAIGRLAAGIAHDFNNLLMGIIGCGGLAKRELGPTHAATPLLNDICEAAQRGASLTRDLLDLSRKKPIDNTPSELNAVVRVAERMLRQVIGEDIEFEVALCESGGPVLANPTHLEHILLNLVVNARDAMPHGGLLRVATIERELAAPLPTRRGILPPGRYVVLEVEDSGSGMDGETLARAFEPFFTTKSTSSGTGLGLYTVYSIVEQLEGGIDVESEVGRGTLFRIHLPRFQKPLAPLERPAPVAPIDAPAPRAGARVLVVEDERLIRVTLRQVLQGMGHEVLVADSGSAACELAQHVDGPIDLLLSDIVLPDVSGPEIAATLLRERPAMKVLFMSAYPADVLVKQGRVPPGTKTLEKPFTEEALTNALRETLGTTTSAPAASTT